MPKLEAYQTAIRNYTSNWPSDNQTRMPTPADYGLDGNTILGITIFGNGVFLLVFLGVAYLLILPVAKLVNRVRGYNPVKSTSITP